MKVNLAPLANELFVPRFGDDLPQPSNYKEITEKYSKRMKKAMERQGIKPQREQRTPSSDGSGGLGGGTGSGTFNRENADERLNEILREFKEDLKEKRPLPEEVSEDFMNGVSKAEKIFQSIQHSIRSGSRIMRSYRRSGIEIDPVALMLKKMKPFVIKQRISKLKTTAVATLFDFSRSMEDMKKMLAFAIPAVGNGFWRLRQVAGKYFNYDISFFTDNPPVTILNFGENISEEDNTDRLKEMTSRIATGGTDLVLAMDYRLSNAQKTGFLDFPQAQSAKTKYMVIFTDGEDDRAIEFNGEKYVFTEAFAEVINRYRAAGIDLIAVGIGKGTNDVRAFDGPGLHFVTLKNDRPLDIANAIAAIADLKSIGDGSLPQGNITRILGLDFAMLNDQHMGGIDLTSNKFLQTQNTGESIKFYLDPAQLAKFQNAPGFVPVIINIQPMTNLRQFLGL